MALALAGGRGYICGMLSSVTTRFPLWLMVASLGVLAMALAWQYVGGVEPCILCIYQRWPYVAVAALAAAGLALDRRPAARAAIIGLCGVALLIGAGIAGFHVGVEQHWWAGTDGCGVDPLAAGNSIDALRAQLLAEPVVPCDVVTWSLFGISMAGYNFVISLGLGATALTVARQLLKEGGR